MPRHYKALAAVIEPPESLCGIDRHDQTGVDVSFRPISHNCRERSYFPQLAITCKDRLIDSCSGHCNPSSHI